MKSNNGNRSNPDRQTIQDTKIDIHVCVYVVSSVPAATWVLLGSEETGLRGERATAITFKQPTNSSPCSSSSNSSTSPFEPRTSLVTDGSSGFKWAQCGGGSGSEGSSPPDLDNVSIASSTGSRLLDIFVRPFFQTINSQGVSDSGTERSGTRTPEPATSSQSPSKTVHVAASKPKPQHTHRKSKSCSQLSDSTPPNVKLSKYVDTPEMDALLRVQPHSIGGPDKIITGGDEGGSTLQWEYSRVFDVYVHPSTFPEISNYYHSSNELGSFLIRVGSAHSSSLRKANSQSQGSRNENVRPSQPAPSDLSSIPENESVSAPVSESRLDFLRIMSAVAGLSSSFHDTQSDISDGGSSVKSDNKPQALVFPNSLVLRLCFATKLVRHGDGRVYPLPHPLPPTIPEVFTASECKEVLRIAPGHIVMSHIVQQQLRVGVCSRVRVSHVMEEGKIPAGQGQLTLYIRTLDKKASIIHSVYNTCQRACFEGLRTRVF